MVRSPADAVVALHSMDRRWRSLFAGLGDDESPDDLAHRIGADGRAASDHAVRATRILSLLDRALEQVLVDEAAVLHPAVTDTARRTWDDEAIGPVDDLMAALARAAERLAERAGRVAPADWARQAAVAGGDTIATLDILWDAVDSAVAELKAAERTLGEVRGRPR